MPRPPMIPVPDWSAICQAGLTWTDWLAQAESADQAARMKERFETLQVPQPLKAKLAALSAPTHVVAIAEDWCGDVVRHAPVIARIAHEQPLVKLTFITRDHDLALFTRFLTNGGEAIPKFIFLNDAFTEYGNWGPMQTDARHLIAQGKALNDVGAARKLVSELYNADPQCETAFRELIDLAAMPSGG